MGEVWLNPRFCSLNGYVTQMTEHLKSEFVRRFIESAAMSSEEIATKTSDIYAAMLHESDDLDAGDFGAIHPDDLQRMFRLYDEVFFEGQCQALLGEIPLGFRLSKRMTRSAGHTAGLVKRGPDGTVLQRRFEVVISSTLLFQSFQGEKRAITVAGLKCRDRLEAMQRVFEHELVHLIETLLWSKSSCSAPRYQSIAGRWFGHTRYSHHLVTSHERALSAFGINLGDRVSFRFEGRQLVGHVNRITKRATVLVENRQGEHFTDGKRYETYYIPLQYLVREVLQPPGEAS